MLCCVNCISWTTARVRATRKTTPTGASRYVIKYSWRHRGADGPTHAPATWRHGWRQTSCKMTASFQAVSATSVRIGLSLGLASVLIAQDPYNSNGLASSKQTWRWRHTLRHGWRRAVRRCCNRGKHQLSNLSWLVRRTNNTIASLTDLILPSLASNLYMFCRIRKHHVVSMLSGYYLLPVH